MQLAHSEKKVQMEPTRGGGMDRRSFLVKSGSAVAGIGALSLGGGLLGACSSSSSTTTTTESKHSLTHLSLQESYINNAEFAGFYCAAKKGFFSKYGLDVDIVAAGTTTDPRQSVANGVSLTGVVSETSDMILGVAEGVPYKCFGASFQQNPGCLMVLASSGIRSVKDLEGKVIGLQDNARQQVIGILGATNVALDKVTLSVVGDDPTPLVEGKIDAYTAYVFNEPIALKMQGINTRCYSYSAIGLPGYGDCLIATDTTLRTQPDLLARFTRASQEGWAYAIAHQAEAVAITLDDYPSGQNATQQKLQMATQVPMLANAATKAHGLMWIDTSIMQAAINAAVASKALAKPVTVGDVMTQEILTRAATVSPV
jgi:ABC-type nitrate/sulfonate/bicarbonate transport system substrate-binding protein